MRELRPGRLRAIVGGLEQCCVELPSLCLLSRLLRGESGMVETIEPVGALLERRFILRQRGPRAIEFEQHIGQHFAGRNIHFALANLVLQIGGGAHVRQGFILFPLRKSHPAQNFTALDPGTGVFGHIRVLAFSYFVYEGIVFGKIGFRLF